MQLLTLGFQKWINLLCKEHVILENIFIEQVSWYHF